MAPAAWAQQPPDKLARVGFLVPEALADQASRVEALRAGLAERGWVEGRNLVIEVRSAEGAYERLPALAAELASLKMDVIVAFGIKSLTAARAATTTLPIVIPATSSDLVALGFVERFARPGKNVTGSTTFGAEIMARRLELLKETAPASKRVGVLVNPANASFGPTFTVMSTAARSLKLSIEPFEVRDRSEFPRAFAAMAKARIDGLVIQDDTTSVRPMPTRLPRWRRSGACWRWVAGNSPMPAAPSATAAPMPICTAAARTSSIESSSVPSPPTCRWSRPPASRWSSTCPWPAPSASGFRSPFCCAPIA
jgi:putative ABC transport system substrate-binding protein